MKSTTSRRELSKPTERVWPSYEEISARAYALYVERGAVEGYAVQDWLQAEQELLDQQARGDLMRAAS